MSTEIIFSCEYNIEESKSYSKLLFHMLNNLEI